MKAQDEGIPGTRDSHVTLINDHRFCVKFSDGCASWKRDVDCRTTSEDVITLSEQTFFAVKTCKKYHSERLPIIFQTWAKAAVNIDYFSEVAEAEYLTKVLPEVNKNTERGHCMKTEAILKYFNRNAKAKGWKWLIITDDDTLLSVHKLLEFLKCYNPEESLAIGQRYGFRVAEGKFGYDYITGGGGMVFSSEMVAQMMQDNGKYCFCPQPNHPDDMHLAGACIANLGFDVTHSDRFHQARPNDYTSDLLLHQDPISFHKFWNNDPIKIYNDYFRNADENLRIYKYNKENKHQEL